MKKVILALVLAMLMPAGAQALDTGDVLALVAMPLAVAAVADVAGVPTNDLVSVVSAMNRARVPAPQFVEVVRYVPVALVERPVVVDPVGGAPFVAYVTEEVDRGVYGNDLAYAMADRIETYGIDEINVVHPQPLYVIERSAWVPPVVVSRLGASAYDPVDLIAMPLAVAAVADVAGVPRSDFFSLVAALNGAYVPPAQFVEIVRYSPLVLADPVYRPQFVPFVTTQIDRGYTGYRLAQVIDDRYDDWGYDEVDVYEPPVRLVDRSVVLPPLVTRVDEYYTKHPHGGPPGQLKKELGLQTGAEVVHGDMPGRIVDRSIDRDRSYTVIGSDRRIASDRTYEQRDRRSTKATRYLGPPAREQRRVSVRERDTSPRVRAKERRAARTERVVGHERTSHQRLKVRKQGRSSARLDRQSSGSQRIAHAPRGGGKQMLAPSGGGGRQMKAAAPKGGGQAKGNAGQGRGKGKH